jgi:LacI family transcriptional regulator
MKSISVRLLRPAESCENFMPKTVTIQDVAREAHTSVSTVSRVLTGSAPVSTEKRAMVEDAIQRMGFRPSHVARSLRTRTTHSIGLLINDVTNPFYSAVAKGVEDEANRHGYSLILCNTSEDPDRELQYLHILRDKQVDGIIFGPIGENVEFIRGLSRRIPLVQVDRRLEGIEIETVMADNEGGACRATHLLLERGHRRIGVMTWNAQIMVLSQRVAGYSRALAEANLPPDPALIAEVPRFSPRLVVEAASYLLATQRPTAIFALNNQLGLGALRAIRDLGLRIPDDVALVVFDDLEVFDLMTPRITAVEQPAMTMGQRAVQLLVERIEGHSDRPPQVAVLPTQLVLRESV